jgi:hypothetical protein
MLKPLMKYSRCFTKSIFLNIALTRRIHDNVGMLVKAS